MEGGNRIDNFDSSRDSWLKAATNELRPDFKKLGCELPEKIRFAIAFTTAGKRGGETGECIFPKETTGEHWNIIIKADKDDPFEILVSLTRMLNKTVSGSRRLDPAYRKIAQGMGLEGSAAKPKINHVLRARLQAIATALGPIPHNAVRVNNSEQKPPEKHFPVVCPKGSYTLTVSTYWAKLAIPTCPLCKSEMVRQSKSRRGKKIKRDCTDMALQPANLEDETRSAKLIRPTQEPIALPDTPQPIDQLIKPSRLATLDRTVMVSVEPSKPKALLEDFAAEDGTPLMSTVILSDEQSKAELRENPPMGPPQYN